MQTTKQILNNRYHVEHTMPKKVLAEWLKALRSDEYHQGSGSLYVEDSDDLGNPGFCCLGVLQHCLTGGVEFYDTGTARSYPSEGFLEDYGINFDNTTDPNFFYADRLTPASELNDDIKLSFKQIANIIEKQVTGV